uniref:Uncharacterized protein n=1 Tax=Candidatus Methanogaster sp. ANME-2c ERB4 TaxID=2759911 RepID=A0A7G9YKI4_9EURY|nr:hypothetical protein IMNOINEI_00018 [Methanosarcinales archaeon ANME-2c ERB4]
MERKTLALGLVFSFTAMLIPAAQQAKGKAAPAIEKADDHLVLEAVKFISPKKVIAFMVPASILESSARNPTMSIYHNLLSKYQCISITFYYPG